MFSFGNILILHPAAIGDAMLATPVARTLRLNFPAAKITYWSHPSLRDIFLGHCPSVDEFLDYSQETSIPGHMQTFSQHKPDLFVDLSGSSKHRPIPWFSGVKTLRYRKQLPGDRSPMLHAVENFLETIIPVCDEFLKEPFPTIFPEAITSTLVPEVLKANELPDKPLVAIVPGVGKFRPHRAWIDDGWIYLVQQLIERGKCIPVLIGGGDDEAICQHIMNSVEGQILNLCGKLNLDETAGFLKACTAAVSGDTGPAHMAVAVGTPVIGLYGPTFPLRSGPYDCLDLVCDQSKKCECHYQKVCSITGPGKPGDCMHRIMLPEIVQHLDSVLSGTRFQTVEKG